MKDKKQRVEAAVTENRTWDMITTAILCSLTVVAYYLLR